MHIHAHRKNKKNKQGSNGSRNLLDKPKNKSMTVFD